MNRFELRNRSPRIGAVVLAIFALGLIASCSSLPAPEVKSSEGRMKSADEVRELERERTERSALPDWVRTGSSARKEYRIGPGDSVRVTVVGRAEVSGAYQVGPDGAVSLPLAGSVNFGGASRAESAKTVGDALAPYFTDRPSVTVDVVKYENNKAYVLGRVVSPGEIDLTTAPTLLQAIARAGGLPVQEFRASPTKCAVIRGNDKLLWIDVRELLGAGNLALNVELENGDVVYLPDAEDTNVFVMGEVNHPGAVPIRLKLRLSQALALAGGPSGAADLTRVFVVRDRSKGIYNGPVAVDFKRIVETGDFADDLPLESGDIVFVARTGLGDLAYTLNQLSPAISAATFGLALMGR